MGSVIIFYIVVVCMFLLAPMSRGNAGLPDDCSLLKNTVSCLFKVPTWLPENVTAVYIQYHKDLHIQNGSFSHSSWKNVTELDITALDGLEILSQNFNQLWNLRTLGLHDRLTNVERDAFNGLKKLQYLDLSNCGRLPTDPLFQAILDGSDTLTNLRSLNLDFLFAIKRRSVKLTSVFFALVSAIPIEFLSLHGTNLLITDGPKGTFRNSLLHFDMSNTTLLRTFSEASNIFTTNIMNGWKIEFFNASFVDLSAFITRTSFSSGPTQLSERKCSFFTRILNVLKYFILNNVNTKPLTISNYLLNLSKCSDLNSSLKVVNLSHNSILKLNATLVLPQNVLQELDLSSNKMVYISPNLLQHLASLEILNLSDNDLWEMKYLPEFALLLQAQASLTYLDLSLNKLACIPTEMFAFNSFLNYLDLSGNNLEAITFRLENLTLLHTVKLHHNQFLFLDWYGMSQIGHVFNRGLSGNNTVTIDMSNNHFLCSCSTLQFMHWIVHGGQRVVNQDNPLKCYFRNKRILIDQSAIDRSKASCQANIITCEVWLLSCIYVFAVIVLIAFIVKRVLTALELRKHQAKIEDFQQKCRQGNLKEKHLMFLSENCQTDDVEEDVIFMQVQENFQRLLTDKISDRPGIDIITADNINGTIGFYRAEAVERFISNCCVVVILVSLTEPENQYMKTDLELARFYNKPVCFLLPKADNKQIPQVINYRTYPTFEIRKRFETWEPDKGWEHLCNCVLDLAVKAHRENTVKPL